jgi:hypothetical protein
MSKTSQSLIATHFTQEGDLVLKYGSFESCAIDRLDIETMVINKSDLMRLSEILAAAASLIEDDEE